MVASFFIRAGGLVGSSYEAEASALFARFSSDPGATRKGHINTCIAALKTAGVWSKLDCLYVFAAHAEADAKLNWITDDDNLVENGTVNFITDVGFIATDTNTANYLLGTRALNSLTQYQQDSAHISAWFRPLSGPNAAVAMADEGGAGTNMYPMYSDNNVYIRVNDSPASGGFTVATPAGFTLGNRSSSTARQGYRNAASVGTYPSTTSGVRPTGKMKYMPGNNLHIINAATIGASLNSTEVTDLYNALNAYGFAVGWTYSVLDAMNKGSNMTLSNAAMTGMTAGGWHSARGTLGRNSGAHYCEFKRTALAIPDDMQVGFVDASASLNTFLGGSSAGVGFRGIDRISSGGTNDNTLVTFTPAVDDVYMLAYDAASGNVWYGRNGTWNNGVTPSTGSNGGRLWYVPASTMLYPAMAVNDMSSVVTFYNRAANFAYAPPSGFSEWG